MVSKSSSIKLSLTRTIHPVGQGAFYSESFLNEERNTSLLTVVYDCGGRMTEFKSQLNTIKRVDLLFISHFHDDHIGGVKMLQKSFPNAIVVIPKISPCRFVVDIIFNYLRTGMTSCAPILFMMSILPSLKSKITQEDIYLQGDREHGCVMGARTITVPSGRRFSVLTPYDWCYDAYYNEYDGSKDRELIKALSVLLPSLDVVLKAGEDDYLESEWYERVLFPNLEQVGDKLHEIKEIYSKVFDDAHNSYSMLVYSHSRNNEIENSDCLYTGDAENSPENKGIIRDIQPHYIQIPHHGSSLNHDPDYYFRRQIAFMSVGYTNSFHHPGSKTMMDLTRICPYVHAVTEYSKTKFKKKFKLI